MRFLIILSVLFSSIPLFAQIDVSDLKDEDLENFKAMKTLFVLRNIDEDQLETYQAIAEEIWTINEMVVISQEALSEFEGVGTYAMLSMEGEITHKGGTTITHYYLRLKMPKAAPVKSKERKPEMKAIARIELYGDGDLIWLNEQRSSDRIGSKKSEKKKYVEPLEYLYTKAKFYNWQPGFIKNALQEVHRYLETGEKRWINTKADGDKNQLAQLDQHTLYFPDYILIDYNEGNGNEDDRHDVNEMFETYKYKYEILSTEELSTKILETKEPFYYFTYVRSSANNYFFVVNSQTGKIIYAMFHPARYNMHSRDLKNLSIAMAKARKSISKK